MKTRNRLLSLLLSLAIILSYTPGLAFAAQDAAEGQGTESSEALEAAQEFNEQQEEELMDAQGGALLEAAAADEESDWTYEIVDDHAVITKYSGSETDLTIPEELGGYPVTELSGESIFQNTQVSVLTFLSNVKVIGAYTLRSSSIKTIILDTNLDPVTDERGLIPTSVSTIILGPEAMTLPYYSNGYDEGWLDGEYLTAYEVDANNPYYKSVDGVLFSKDGTILIRYPRYRDGGSYTVPDGTVTIDKSAFSRNLNLIEVHIPDSTVNFEKNALGQEDIASFSQEPMLIYASEGSAAETYAIQQGFTLGVIPDPNDKKSNSTRTITSSGKTKWDGQSSSEIAPVGTTYTIKTAAQLYWLSEQVAAGNNFKGCKVLLASDIDLGNKPWVPIGTWDKPFAGNFDGQNHTISNLNLNGKYSYNGLFGCIATPKTSSVTVENLKINKVRSTGTGGSYTGALSGSARTARGSNLTIQNINITDVEMQCDGVAGAVGRVWCGHGSSMVNVEKIEVQGTLAMGGGTSSSGGGIIARIDMKDHDYEKGFNGDILVKNCKYRGKLYTKGRWGTGGGMVGSLDDSSSKKTLTIEHCRVDGYVTAGSAATGGGIISGLPSGQTLKECVNYADVYGYYAGGLTSNNDGTIIESYNEGWASAQLGGNNGGMVSTNNGIIFNSYNAGTAPNSSALAYNGAIASNGNGTVENVYNIGEVAKQGNTSVAVSQSGVFGYTSGQTLIHSYYDTAEGGYIFGDVKELTVMTDPSLNITDSGGKSTAVLKTEGGYTNWDFEDVWEFDLEYSWGYPTVSSIKDLMDKHPDTETKNKLKKTKFKFNVVDQAADPVEGALITLAEGSSNEAALTTDKLGKANTPWQDGKLGIKIEKEGYITYEDPDFAMNAKKEITMMIIDKNKVDDYPLSSVIMEQRVTTNMGTVSDLRYELLSQSRTINRQWSVESVLPSMTYDPFTLKATLADKSKNYISAELIQGPNDSEAIAYASDPMNPVFTNLEYDSFVETNKGATSVFKGGKQDVKIRLKYDNGTKVVTSIQKINLLVSDEAALDFEIKFDDGLEFTVPTNIPIVGGVKIAVPLFRCPVTASVEDDKVQIGFNIARGKMKKMEDGWKKISRKDLKDDASLKKMLKEYSDIKSLKDINQGLGPVKFSWGIVGYGEADLPFENVITAHLIVELKVSIGGETQVYIFVFGLEGSGKVTGDGSVDINFNKLRLDDGVGGFMDGFENGAIELGGEVGFGLYAGLGLANVASVGVYGTPALGFTYNIVGGDHSAVADGIIKGLEEVYLQGTVSLAVRFMGSGVVDIPVTSGKVNLYKWSDAYDPESQGGRRLMKALRAASQDEVTESTEAAAGAWTGGDGTLQESAYSGASPVVMNAGGDRIMIFTSNTDESRAAADRSKLMFSVLDKDTNTWSEPQPVHDDGTGDFYPAVSGKYVVWNNAKGTLAGTKTYTDLGIKTEVAVAQYDPDSKSFVSMGNITSNDRFENRLAISGGSDSPVITWTVDETDDMFGIGGVNTSYSATLSGGSWSVSEEYNISSIIVAKASGMLNGSFVKAFVVDEDSDFTTLADRHLYVSKDGAEPVKVSDTVVTQVAFAESAGKLLFVDDMGDLYSMTSADAEPTQDTDDGRVGTGIISQVIDEEDGKISIITTKGENGRSVPYVISCSASGKWSNPVKLLDQSGYIDSINAWYEGDELVYAYNQRTVKLAEGDNPYSETNSLKWSKSATGKADLTLSNIVFYPNEVVAGENLEISTFAVNNGFKSLDRVGAKITATINKTETVISDEVIETELIAGAETLVNVNLPVPDDAVKREYTLTLYDPDDTEVSATAKVTIGSANFSIDKEVYEIGGHEIINAIVTNTGFEAGSGTLEFYDTNNPDKVLDTYKFGSLEPDEVVTYSFRPDEKGLQFNSLRLGMRVIDRSGNILTTDRQAQLWRDTVLPPSGVMLNQNYATIENVGDTLQLVAGVTPASAAENAVVHWESSNPDDISVDENGLVTANRAGKATITVYTDDYKYYDECLVYAGMEDISECTIKQMKTRYGVSYDYDYSYSSEPIEPTFKLYSGKELLIAGVDYEYEYRDNNKIGDAHLIITGKGHYTGTIDKVFKIKENSDFDKPDITGFTIDKDSADLILDTDVDDTQISYELTPADAGDFLVRWTSSDESVATVSSGYVDDETGKGYTYINAVGPGTCTVTGKTRDGGFTRTVSVTVSEKIRVTDIEVLPSQEVWMSPEDSMDFMVNVFPEDAYEKGFYFEVVDGDEDLIEDYTYSGRDSVFGIDSTGSTGDATIKVYSYEDENIYKLIKVHVTNDSSKVPMFRDSVKEVHVGAEDIDIEPGSYGWDENDDYYEIEDFARTSSDESVLEIDEDGCVNALKLGSAVITTTGKLKGKSFSVKCYVKVTESTEPISSLSLYCDLWDEPLFTGQQTQLRVGFYPSVPRNKELIWSSSDESIATVDQNGLVTGHKPGTVTIKAEAVDHVSYYSEVSDTVEITVEDYVPLTNVTMEQESYDVPIRGALYLTPVYTPENATDKELEWTVEDDDISSVWQDYKGTVYVNGYKEGTTTVTGRSKDGIEVSFTVNVYSLGSIEDADITLSQDHFTYDGEPKKPDVKVVLNGKTLVENQDYGLYYGGWYTGVGEAYVEIYGMNGYEGAVYRYYTIGGKKITPTVKLSATSYTWDGKAKTPGVTVKDGSTTLEKDIDYTVTYASGRKNVGTYKVTVKCIDGYEGSKSVSFKINPKGTSLSKLTPAKKAITVKWAKQSKKMSSSVITGYQIQLATDSKFKKNVKNVNVSGYSKVSKKVTGLKAKTKYYVRIRTYKTVSGTKYYSPWSKSKNTKTK